MTPTRIWDHTCVAADRGHARFLGEDLPTRQGAETLAEAYAWAGELHLLRTDADVKPFAAEIDIAPGMVW